DSVDVGLRRLRGVDVLAGEDVTDFADAVDGAAGLADQREVVGLAGREGEVGAVRRADVVAGLADKRPGDDAPDGVLAGEDLARRSATLIELLQRDRSLVAGDLEDGVGRRVDDPLSRSLVLLPELLDDLGARSRLV